MNCLLTKYINHIQPYKSALISKSLSAFVSEMKVFDLVLIGRDVREGSSQITY